MRTGRIKKIDSKKKNYKNRSIIKDGNEYQGFMVEDDISYNQHMNTSIKY
jgi:hypothetical protein